MQLVRKYFSYIVFGVLTFIAIGIWGAVFAATPPGVLTIAVMDVGQGDSIFIESPTGTQVVIDGGPDNSLLRELPKLMPLSDRTIDAIIESHPHADHITGFVDLLKRYSVRAFVEPGVIYDSLIYRVLEKEVADQHLSHYVAHRGMVLDLGGDAHLDVLYPDKEVTHLATKDVHEGNVVMHLVYGNTSVLLTGDAPMDVEDHLMQISSTTELKSDILKVGHHGSRYSTGGAFLSEVRPSVAIISVGAHNTYGHPTQQTLNKLDEHTIETLRTDKLGTIIFVSDGLHFVRTQ